MVFRGPSWELKSIKNQSKYEANMGRSLGIDFEWILVGYGGQVGKENGAKSDPKRHRKMIKAAGGFGSVLMRFQEGRERLWKTRAG